MRQLYRLLFYLLGQIILAAGLTLSTKVHLGVSPILSIAYCASEITGCTIGDASLFVYIACIVAEVILHFRQEIVRSDKKRVIISDLLQLPVSFLFTRLMDLLSHHMANVRLCLEKAKSADLQLELTNDGTEITWKENDIFNSREL